MENKTIPALSEGLNEVIRADLISDAQATQLDNYFTDSVGVVTLRSGFRAHQYNLPNNKNAVPMVPVCLWTWIPHNYPVDHFKPREGVNYVLLIYDADNDLYLLKLEEGIGWVNALDTNIPVFEGIGIPRITETNYGIALCDGRDNSLAKYIAINQWGEVRYGDIGVPAPLALAELLLGDENNNYVEDESLDVGMDIPRGAIVFFTYTMVTKDGIESNPAPLLVDTSLNYLKRYYDEDTPENSTYEIIDKWQKATFDGLRTILADKSGVGEVLEETLEYFNVYLSWTKYTESGQARTEFRLARRVAVGDLTGDNSYVSTTPYTGKHISYENNVACKGDDIAHAGGVTFLANANSTIQFPFDFAHYVRITLNNNNSRNYVDGAIWIRLYYAEIKDRDGNDLIGDDTEFWWYRNSNQLRLYDSDLTTPLPVVFQAETTYVDVLVKIPYIAAQIEHNIYLCIGGDGVPEAIAGQTDFRTAKYGRWLQASTEFANQLVLNPNRVRESQGSLVISCEEHSGTMPVGEEQYAINRRDDNNKLMFDTGGVVPPSVKWDNRSLEYLKIFSQNLLLLYESTEDNNAIFIVSSGPAAGNATAYIENTLMLPIPSKGFVSFFFAADLDADPNSKIVLIEGDVENYIRLEYEWVIDDPNYHRFRLVVSNNAASYESPWLDVFDWGGASSIDRCSILFSWDRDSGQLYLSVQRLLTSINELEVNIPLGFIPDHSQFDIKLFGVESDTVGQYTYFSQVSMYGGVYIDDAIHVSQILSMMPHFPEEWLGYHEADLENKNITIHTAEEIGYQSRMGLLRYSSLGGQTFPAINQIAVRSQIMRIVPAPNYLHNGEYINSVLIFGVNGERLRFLLRGTTEGWQAQITDLLVKEQADFGLVSRDAILLVGETIYWIAPIGLLRENMDGMINLSKDKVNLPNWDLYNPALTYNPQKNMILIHEGIDYEALVVVSFAANDADGHQLNVGLTAVTSDVDGNTEGETSFNRMYKSGTNVSAAAPEIEGYEFDEWQLNGLTETTNNTVTINNVTQDITLTAMYTKTYILTIQSAPTACENITSDTPDVNGENSGITEFSLEYREDVGSVVLTAPEYHEGLLFNSWEKDGEHFSDDQAITTDPITEHATYKANYAIEV